VADLFFWWQGRITSRLRRDVILLGGYLQRKALQRFALSQPFLIHPVA